MNLFEELALVKEFIRFVSLKTAEERKNLIGGEPALLSSEGIEIVQQFINAENQLAFSDHLNLLLDCQTKGLEAIDTFYSTCELQSEFIQFSEGFNSFAKRKNYLINHPELYSEKGIRAINILIEESRQKGFGEEYLTKFRLYRNLLREIVVKGVNRTFEEYGISSPEVIAEINALFLADNHCQAFTAYLMLQNDRLDTVKALNYLIAKYENDPERLKTVQALREALAI